MIIMYTIILIIIIISLIYYTYIYTNTEKKELPIVYYHPIIKKYYCRLIILKKLKNIDIDPIKNKLLKYNNNLLINNQYINLDDRYSYIYNNIDIQTIFNYINNIDKID
jgi:hypothetical protein